MIFCVDAFNVVPVHGMVEAGFRGRPAEEAFCKGMVAGRHIPPGSTVRGWLPKPVFDCMPKNQSAKSMEIKISIDLAVSAILHDADLAVPDAVLLDMCGGTNFASRTMDWNALTAMFKSHR